MEIGTAKTVAEKEIPVAKCRNRAHVSEEHIKCLSCRKEGEGNDKLGCFSTLETYRSIRQKALKLGDFELLGRMSEGDLIATEAKNHLKCLISLRNQYRSFCAQKMQDSDDGLDDVKLDESVAFVELVKYIDHCVDDGTYMPELSELFSLYVQRLEDLGIRKTI